MIDFHNHFVAGLPCAALEKWPLLGDERALPLFAKVLASKGAGDAVKSFTLHAAGRLGAHPSETVRREAFETIRPALDMKAEMRQSALLAVLSGEAQLMFSPMPSSIAMVKAGRLKAIAITSPKRASQMPDVPTIAEAGLPTYEFQGWYGLLAPAGVPQPILAKLSRDFNAALEDPATRNAMTSRGAEPLGGSMEHFSQFLRREVKKYAEVAKEAGIRAQ